MDKSLLKRNIKPLCVDDKRPIHPNKYSPKTSENKQNPNNVKQSQITKFNKFKLLSPKNFNKSKIVFDKSLKKIDSKRIASHKINKSYTGISK